MTLELEELIEDIYSWVSLEVDGYTEAIEKITKQSRLQHLTACIASVPIVFTPDDVKKLQRLITIAQQIEPYEGHADRMTALKLFAEASIHATAFSVNLIDRNISNNLYAEKMLTTKIISPQVTIGYKLTWISHRITAFFKSKSPNSAENLKHTTLTVLQTGPGIKPSLLKLFK